MKKAVDLEGDQTVVYPLDVTIPELPNFLGHLGQLVGDSPTAILKQSLLQGVSERTALLAEPRASVVPDLQASRTIVTRLIGHLNRMFPEDKPEDAMSIASLMCTEIYLLIATCLPELFTSAQEHAIHVAPTFSLGHLDTISLAASTIANLVISVSGFTVVQGFTSALDSLLISDNQMGSYWCLMTAVLMAATVLPILYCWSYITVGLILLGQDSEMVVLVSLFLNIAAVGIPAYALNEIAKRFLAHNGLSTIQKRVAALSAPLSISLNYLLVHGPPAFRAGFAGAPASSVVCHYTISILTAVCVLPAFFRFKRADSSVQSTGPAFFVGSSQLLSSGVIGRAASAEWSKHAGGLTACMLGPRSLAAQAALIVTVSCFNLVPRAIHTASTARINVLLRRGNFRKAKGAALASLAATLLVALTFSNLVLGFGPSWGRLFTSDPMVIEVIAGTMPFIVVYQAIDGVSSWTNGALISLGYSATFPIIKASSDSSIGIPLGIYLAFVLRWNLAGMWGGLVASSACALLIGLAMLVRAIYKPVGIPTTLLHSRTEAQNA
ncbi:hypothetical protein FIBSPDRAFT_1039313 [Athelia psychrophila]|uniref:MATE efflux family protein n=1 Tax=Athelia psychrophila TaxID=1759441 RepID=A0A166S3H5_9AGAM|nr:hypothetical protein FIBSPDRAFT_1039313 [Fibularhizoctonia sp. CBS 109695]